jgi:hypothetical protein
MSDANGHHHDIFIVVKNGVKRTGIPSWTGTLLIASRALTFGSVNKVFSEILIKLFKKALICIGVISSN